jgi:hypothetical protein
MAFTWTGDPAASTIEKIRWEIGDTDSTNPKFTDAEVQYAYDQEHSVYPAAARLCEQLATTLADSVDRSLGPLSVKVGQKIEFYTKRAKELRKHGAKYATPYVGGISKDKEELFEDDTDLNQPYFEMGMHDNS